MCFLENLTSHFSSSTLNCHKGLGVSLLSHFRIWPFILWFGKFSMFRHLQFENKFIILFLAPAIFFFLLFCMQNIFLFPIFNNFLNCQIFTFHKIYLYKNKFKRKENHPTVANIFYISTTKQLPWSIYSKRSRQLKRNKIWIFLQSNSFQIHVKLNHQDYWPFSLLFWPTLDASKRPNLPFFDKTPLIILFWLAC